jgi:hypothetical protein
MLRVSLPQILISVGIAVIPAAAAIVAAVIAARAATRARNAEGEAARLRAAEERIAGPKADLYKPILDGFGNMLIPGNAEAALPEIERAMPAFLNGATVWASDEALQAFYRFRRGSATSPPNPILFRLVADFFVAARVDLTGMPTKVSGLEVLGIRMTDLSEHPEVEEAFTMPFDELAKKHNWTIPWE